MNATAVCPGPLIWFDVDDGREPAAAVLECAACEYVCTTGNLHDEQHGTAPLLREGMA